MNAGKAIYGLIDIFDNPVKPGNKNILNASKEVLDRIGIIKKEPTAFVAKQIELIELTFEAKTVFFQELELHALGQTPEPVLSYFAY
jgi:hypothetical protein